MALQWKHSTATWWFSLNFGLEEPLDQSADVEIQNYYSGLLLRSYYSFSGCFLVAEFVRHDCSEVVVVVVTDVAEPREVDLRSKCWG